MANPTGKNGREKAPQKPFPPCTDMNKFLPTERDQLRWIGENEPERLWRALDFAAMSWLARQGKLPDPKIVEWAIMNFRTELVNLTWAIVLAVDSRIDHPELWHHA